MTWQTRKLGYGTDVPLEDWHIVTEKFFRCNMGRKRTHIKADLLAFLETHPGTAFKTLFREFRFMSFPKGGSNESG